MSFMRKMKERHYMGWEMALKYTISVWRSGSLAQMANGGW